MEASHRVGIGFRSVSQVSCGARWGQPPAGHSTASSTWSVPNPEESCHPAQSSHRHTLIGGTGTGRDPWTGSRPDRHRRQHLHENNNHVGGPAATLVVISMPNTARTPGRRRRGTARPSLRGHIHGSHLHDAGWLLNEYLSLETSPECAHFILYPSLINMVGSGCNALRAASARTITCRASRRNCVSVVAKVDLQGGPRVIRGKCFVTKDNIDTDQIIPAEYLTLVPSKPDEYEKLGSYALIGLPDDQYPTRYANQERCPRDRGPAGRGEESCAARRPWDRLRAGSGCHSGLLRSPMVAEPRVTAYGACDGHTGRPVANSAAPRLGSLTSARAEPSADATLASLHQTQVRRGGLDEDGLSDHHRRKQFWVRVEQGARARGAWGGRGNSVREPVVREDFL